MNGMEILYSILFSVLFSLLYTVVVYLLVPILFCIFKDNLNIYQIKKIIIVNSIFAFLLSFVLSYILGDGPTASGAVCLWPWIGYKIMRKRYNIPPEKPIAIYEQGKKSCRRMMWWTLVSSAVGVILYSVVLVPLYNSIANDILYDSTPWPTVLYLLVQSVEPVLFILIYPALFYAMWRGGLKGACPALIAFGGWTIGKYVINFFMTCIDEGALPTAERFWGEDVPLIGGMLVLELLQHALVVLAAFLWLRSYRRTFPWPAEGLSDGDAFLAARGDVLPLGQLSWTKNPLMLMSFTAACIMLVGRLCNHLIYPLTLIVHNGWMYSWKVVLLDVVADIVICAIGYLVALWVLTAFDRWELKRFCRK